MSECLKIKDMHLFVSNYGKSMTLDEFDSIERQKITATLKYLKEPWINKIVQSIRMRLRVVGKGWFNLEQKFHSVYDMMKLKRFMQLVVFCMQVR